MNYTLTRLLTWMTLTVLAHAVPGTLSAAITSVADSTGANAQLSPSLFGPGVLMIRDRAHSATNAIFFADTRGLRYGAIGDDNYVVAEFPSYLTNQPFVWFTQGTRGLANYSCTVAVDRPSTFYLLVDNRVSDTTTASSEYTEPTFGNGALVWTSGTSSYLTNFPLTQWFVDDGWSRVNTGLSPGPISGESHNPSGTINGDYVGLDEGTDGTVNNAFAVYAKAIPTAGSVTIRQQAYGANIYCVVVAPYGGLAPDAATFPSNRVSVVSETLQPAGGAGSASLTLPAHQMGVNYGPGTFIRVEGSHVVKGAQFRKECGDWTCETDPAHLAYGLPYSSPASYQAPFPPYLLGQPYSIWKKNTRGQTNYACTFQLSAPATAYLLVDNRWSDMNRTYPNAEYNDPSFGPSAQVLAGPDYMGGGVFATLYFPETQWVLDQGFQRVNTGLTPAWFSAWPEPTGGYVTNGITPADYVGIDEGNNGDQNQCYAVFQKLVPAGGTVTMGTPPVDPATGLGGGGDYYSLVFAPVPLGLSAVKSNGVPLVQWSALYPGMTLEYAASLPATNWTAVPRVQNLTNVFSVPMDATGSDSKFYRLRLTYTPTP